MKILFFVSSMHAGGAERVAATLANAWANRGDRVTLVPTYTKKGSCFYELEPAVRLVWLADRLGALTRRLLPSLGKWFAIRRLIRELEPDVIVSFLTNVNVVVLSATRGMSLPVIVCERTNPAFSSSAGEALKRLRRSLYPRASVVVLQSEDSVAAFQKMVPGLRDIAVVPNPMPPGIDEVRAVALPRSVDSAASAISPGAAGSPASPASPRRFVLAGMGRFVPSKRFDALIAAFATLASKYPEWDLVIWGEGPERGRLEQLVADAGLSSRISLPGRTSTPWEEVARVDAFAMTSEVEGFPNVLLEAMALGRACVTVDCPSGPREITDNGKYGLLVPLGEETALRDALEQVMADSALRKLMGQRAAASVRERYGQRSVLEQWDQVFDRAAAQTVRKQTT